MPNATRRLKFLYAFFGLSPRVVFSPWLKKRLKMSDQTKGFHWRGVHAVPILHPPNRLKIWYSFSSFRVCVFYISLEEYASANFVNVFFSLAVSLMLFLPVSGNNL